MAAIIRSPYHCSRGTLSHKEIARLSESAAFMTTARISFYHTSRNVRISAMTGMSSIRIVGGHPLFLLLGLLR